MNYTVLDLIKLVYWKILTPTYFRKAKIIRQPLRLRGKKYMRVGPGFTTGICCRIEVLETGQKIKPELFIGRNVEINDFVQIACARSVFIGDNTLIASNVFISDHDHGTKVFDGIPPSARDLYIKDVYIGSNVWLGKNVCILKGVRIGDNVIVGAGSVVTKDIPSNSIAVGSPARVIEK